MIKKVLLVKPPEISRFNFGTFSLGVLAAAIRHMADVTILDATSLSIDDTVHSIWMHNPDVVGITVMGVMSVRPVVELIKTLKNSNKATKNSTILVGGHGASMAYSPLLASGADAVILGEGELTIQQVLKEGIIPNSPGVVCKSNGEVIVGGVQKLIRPLDSLLPPARDLMPQPPDGIHLMETSRGCPHSCAFCETTRFYGQSWRPYSPERVVSEVHRLVEDYDAWIIHFADDNFTASPKRVIEICEKLQQIQLPAFFMASARGDDLISHPDLIPAMASARILRVSVGVETNEPEMAKVIDKPISLEVYKEAFKRMREHGIFSVASFIIGLPGEKPEMRQRAVDLAVEAGPDCAHFLPFLPLPGIPLKSVKGEYDPDPVDIRDAELLNKAFSEHKIVRNRLEEASECDAIRGMLAKATLRNYGI